MDAAVQTRFEAYPKTVQPKLEYLRSLIFEVANNTEGVGQLEETLKWGEPSYLTSKSGSGTTIRIDWKEKHPDRYALYLNCNTSLVDSYRSLFPELNYEGNRAILLSLNKKPPEAQLRICIQMALTYHLNKKQKA